MVRTVCPEDSTWRLWSVTLGSGGSPLLGLFPMWARLSPGVFPPLVVCRDQLGSAGKASGFGRWLAAPCSECYSPLAISFAIPPESREVTATTPSRPPRVVRGTACGEWARCAPGGSVDRGILSSVRPNRVVPPSRVEPRRAGTRGLRRCR
ncbi:hypothetical protein chiPu_0003071 [Chiloscyllium punctatum]|uniref:Uncharacterized protein n=1 Tax=Chiloscyllium punctatum TaxID=137246 RepID=A0A401S2U0_CHIPU|nr:hypothetical protein [Chiloscyllium punctatum]